MEEDVVGSLGREDATRRPLPLEGVLVRANLDALERGPKVEELHQHVDRELSGDVTNPRSIWEAMLDGVAALDPRSRHLDPRSSTSRARLSTLGARVSILPNFSSTDLLKAVCLPMKSLSMTSSSEGAPLVLLEELP
jgi:hypothetical protein